MFKIYLGLLILIIMPINMTRASTQEDIYLIVGSTREERAITLWRQKMHGTDTDFTHSKTFNGQAVTIDLDPCLRQPEAKHIKADITSYKPKKNQILKDVFFELFPSVDPGSINIGNAKIHGTREQQLRKCLLMSDAVKNLSQYMVSNSKLVIEHIPHTTILNLEDYYDQSFGQSIIKNNPFHFVNPPMEWHLIQMTLFEDPNEQNAYWKNLTMVMNSSAALMIDNKQRAQLFQRYLLDLERYRRVIPVMEKAIQGIAENLETTPQKLKGLLKPEVQKLLQDRYAFDVNKSLCLIILQEFAMLTQRDDMIHFFEEIGFKNITVEKMKEKNEFNGRKNSWIISAYKR